MGKQRKKARFIFIPKFHFKDRDGSQNWKMHSWRKLWLPDIIFGAEILMSIKVHSTAVFFSSHGYEIGRSMAEKRKKLVLLNWWCWRRFRESLDCKKIQLNYSWRRQFKSLCINDVKAKFSIVLLQSWRQVTWCRGLWQREGDDRDDGWYITDYLWVRGPGVDDGQMFEKQALWGFQYLGIRWVDWMNWKSPSSLQEAKHFGTNSNACLEDSPDKDFYEHKAHNKKSKAHEVTNQL